MIIIPLNGGMKKGKRGGRAAAVLRSPASELQASAGGTPSHAASPLLCTHRHHQVIVDNYYSTSENYLYCDRLDTARSAEVEPPGLGSKCGKWVERFSDFGKYKGNFRNHTTSLPAYRTLSK